MTFATATTAARHSEGATTKIDPLHVAFLAGWINRLLDQAWRR